MAVMKPVERSPGVEGVFATQVRAGVGVGEGDVGEGAAHVDGDRAGLWHAGHCSPSKGAAPPPSLPNSRLRRRSRRSNAREIASHARGQALDRAGRSSCEVCGVFRASERRTAGRRYFAAARGTGGCGRRRVSSRGARRCRARGRRSPDRSSRASRDGRSPRGRGSTRLYDVARAPRRRARPRPRASSLPLAVSVVLRARRVLGVQAPAHERVLLHQLEPIGEDVRRDAGRATTSRSWKRRVPAAGRAR